MGRSNGTKRVRIDMGTQPLPCAAARTGLTEHMTRPIQDGGRSGSGAGRRPAIWRCRNRMFRRKVVGEPATQETTMRATPFWVSLVLAPTLVGAALVMTEANFVSDSIKGDNSEVALGQLAVSKATGEPVRSSATPWRVTTRTQRRRLTNRQYSLSAPLFFANGKAIAFRRRSGERRIHCQASRLPRRWRRSGVSRGDVAPRRDADGGASASRAAVRVIRSSDGGHGGK